MPEITNEMILEVINGANVVEVADKFGIDCMHLASAECDYRIEFGINDRQFINEAFYIANFNDLKLDETPTISDNNSWNHTTFRLTATAWGATGDSYLDSLASLIPEHKTRGS